MSKSTCCDKSELKKGPWTAEEDQKLIDYIQKHGHGRWRTLPKNAGLKRCGKSCRLRWTNYLRPDIKRGKFSLEEEEMIIQLHSVIGNKWSAIAARLPGRTDNEIKNYWNTHIRKRLLSMGIDPVTHKPHLDLLQLYSAVNSSLWNNSQLNHVPRLLENGSMLHPNLLNLAASHLSCKDSGSQDFSPKKFMDYHLAVAQLQVQHQFPTLQRNHFHDQMEPFTNSSSAQFLNQNQFMQTNLEQISRDPTSSKYPDSLLGSWQARQPTSMVDSFIPNCGYQVTHQSIIDAKAVENLPNLSFTSLLSTTPSSSTTPLNSSTIYVNCGNEDERELLQQYADL